MKLAIQNLALLLISTAVLTFSCSQLEDKDEPIASPRVAAEPAKVQQKAVDKNVLVGDWVRTDADYRIQISELMDNNMMKAGYFNPKSINVDKAMWAFKDGLLQMYIELKDENYPGSSYTLAYMPERDLLTGKYFQAVEGVTYDVGFVRKNK